MSRATFPRCARLLRPADFARLRGTSRRIGGDAFRAEILTSPEPRLGLVVSRRVSRSAVRRNRIKRIARDSFRRHRASLPPFDIVLIARDEADRRDNADLRHELERLWRRIAALNDAGGAGTMRA